MDIKTRRLFVGCDNKMMAIVNADTGKNRNYLADRRWN